MERHLHKLITDFLNCGRSGDQENIFGNDSLARHFSQMVQGKNPKRQFSRHGLVPTAFINFLKSTEIGQCDINWPRGRITVKNLDELLKGCHKLISIRKYPWLIRSFL